MKPPIRTVSLMFCGIAISHPAFGSDRDRGAWNLVTVPEADEQPDAAWRNKG